MGTTMQQDGSGIRIFRYHFFAGCRDLCNTQSKEATLLQPDTQAKENKIVAPPRAPQKSTAVDNSKILPLSGAVDLWKFSAKGEFRSKYEKAKALLSNKLPGASMEQIFETALDALLDKIDPARQPSRESRRPKESTHHTRYIPREIQRQVWREAQWRCTYVSPDGRRCDATHDLQIDHCEPWAMGGSSTDISNLRLVYRSHNLFFARQTYGEQKI